MSCNVSELAIYPVKSAGRIRLEKMDLDHRGPLFDRAWMVIDKNNRFVTQRKFSSMCLIQTTLHANSLQLSAPGMSVLNISRDPVALGQTTIDVIVWKDTVNVIDCGDKPAAWLSDYLEYECRLVYMPEQSRRLVDVAYAKQQQTVGFADGFPLLIASEASLASFNADLVKHGSSIQIDMQRFRPNIVVSGCEPYAEDGWQKIQIGDIVLSLVKPCSRCIMPAVDQNTGIKQMDIVEVLNKTRRRERKTYFGQNALHDRAGSIRLGDTVKIID